MKLTTAIVLLAAGSLAAAHGAHRHAHQHLHKRDTVVTTVVSPDTVYVYELNGVDVPTSEVCAGISAGKYDWADGTAPPGACVTSTSSSTSISAAVFLEISTSSKSTTSTTSTPPPPPPTTSKTPTPTPTPTSTTPPPPPPTTSTSHTTSAAAAPTAPGTTSGGVTIVNNVGQPVYIWTTSNVAGTMITIPVGGSYAEEWLVNPDTGGISIKISTTPEESDIMQFEYTLIPPVIWWDVSLINMAITSLFDTLGFTVTSDSSACLKVTCPAGDTQCNDAYLYPSDNQATRACDDTTNMVLNLGPSI
jgi:hypothetical protein